MTEQERPRTEAGRELAARAKRESWSNWEGLAQFVIPAIEKEAARTNEGDVMQTTSFTDRMKEAIIWMTGSDDFAPGGKAHDGFEKIVRPVLDDPAFSESGQPPEASDG